jgi:type IV secretion system protein VirB9
MRTLCSRSLWHISAVALIVMALMSTAQAQPITTDSRIKTFVYNPNEVFTVTTHYGYQSNVEFGPKEEIDTISLGDRVGWQVTPAGRRLFIRAQEENAHTNMTVVTNLRAYQFDLRSSSADAVFGSAELTYVVRFFYPDEANNRGVAMPPPTLVAPQPVAAAPAPAPAPTTPMAAAPMPAHDAMNYRYTYSGPSAVAPLKIYDDGRSTYFKFGTNAIPDIAILTAKGDLLPIAARRTPEGLVAVEAVAPRFAIRQAGQQVLVYNEAGGVM